MTNIRLHGLLSKTFGSTVRLHLGRLTDVMSALDAIKEGFKQKVLQLHNLGQNYVIHVDSQSGDLHILPMICGAGKTLGIVIGVALAVVGVLLIAFSAGASSALFQIGLTVATAGASLALQSLLQKKPPTPDQIRVATGGQTSDTGTQGKSYIFNNAQNVASQGSSIPLGYGKLRVGSKLINVSVKSFPTNLRFTDEVAIGASTLELDIYD